MYNFYYNAIHATRNQDKRTAQRVMCTILNALSTLEHFKQHPYEKMQLTIEACKQVHYLEEL